MPLMNELCNPSPHILQLCYAQLHLVLFLVILTSKETAGSSRKNGSRSSKKTNWRWQFCYNLTKLIAFYANTPLQACHLELLKTTPFYHFLLPFINKAVILDCIKGTKSGVEKILDTYDKKTRTFRLGNKQLVITPAEFSIIMGIQSGNRDINTKDTQVSPDSLLKRKFNGISLVKPTHLKTQILSSLASPDFQDIYDSVRIIILHVRSSILFVSTSEVARVWMFRVCENLDELCTYNWGTTVLDYLMNYVNTKSPQDVQGCTTFLQV